jgi:CBS domain-containing protein
MTVRAILSMKGLDVTTASPEDTLLEAAKKLSEQRIGSLVITGAERRVAGILSERDIVRAVSQRGEAALNLPVKEFMTKSVTTCTPDDTMNVLMSLMTAGRFRHLPVVENGKLAGIISIGDVVKFRVAEMERESEALKQYILTA